MRGAATQAMSDIVEERQQSRCPPAAAPLRAAARRPAGFVARSSHTAPGIARHSRLASGPGGLQQNVKLFLREPLVVNAACLPSGAGTEDCRAYAHNRGAFRNRDLKIVAHSHRKVFLSKTSRTLGFQSIANFM